jgi:rhodanese-related sulfurtransferase
MEAGIAPVFSIEGGTAAWISAGLPVERRNVRAIALERQVRIAAGSLVLIGSLLAMFVHLALIAIPIFIGSGLVFAGITDFCGMGMLLARMPWNQKVACRD